MMRKLWRWVVPVLLGTCTLASAGPTEDEEGELKTIVLAPGGKLDAPDTQQTVLQYRKEKKVPDDVSLRVVLTHHHDGSVRFRWFLRSLVPLDAQGQPDGEEVEYVWLAGPVHSTTYRHGVRHGLERMWSGSRSGPSYLTSETPWENGKIHGVKKVYLPGGKVMSQTTYEHGQMTGESRTYDEEGRLLRITFYNSGKKHGELHDFWPESGKLQRSIPYNNGKVDGTSHEYYSNGQLKREASVKNNAMHGLERQFEPDGKLLSTHYWLQGEEVTESEFRKGRD